MIQACVLAVLKKALFDQKNIGWRAKRLLVNKQGK
jgi:hypothetical protein